MLMLEQLRAHARYNRWMNRKVYAAAAGLEAATRTRDSGAFFGSVQGTLNHILLADRTWMLRFTGDSERFVSRTGGGEAIPITGLAQQLYTDFGELERERVRTDEDILAWVGGIEEPALAADFYYRTNQGAQRAHPLWWAVTHFFNHQTHHRGQVTTLLTQANADVGSTDLIYLFAEESGALS